MGEVRADDGGRGVEIPDVHHPDAGAGALVEYHLGMGANRAEVRFVVEKEADRVVVDIHAVSFGLIVGH